MSLIFKIAWRNILRHKGKSFIIGIILFLGAFLMTLGSAVISGMDEGMQKNIVERFTGDIVLISTNQKDEAVIAGGMLTATEVLSGYTNVKMILQKQDYINSFLPVCRGVSMVLNESGDMGFTFLLGVDFDKYQKFFLTNIVVEEGRTLSVAERGSLVSTGSRKNMYRDMGIWLTPADSPFIETHLSPDAMSNRDGLNIQSNVVLMGMSADGNQMDIRTPVRGVFKYKYLNNFWESYNLLDLDSFRECFGYVTTEDTAVNISQEKKAILSEDENLDKLFGEQTVVKGVETGKQVYRLGSLKRTEKKALVKMDEDLGIYNIVFIKLKDGKKIEKNLIELNKVISNNQLSVKAITWKKAAGTIGDTATIMKIILIVFVVLLFFVAVIIITNTLSMAALERTTEIGMMRAVGADRNFISGMFVGETFLLSAVFGGFGILAAGITSQILYTLKISGGTNEALQLLFGGDIFKPILHSGDIIFCIFLLLIVTLFAVLYPIFVARHITPLEAIARE